MAVGRNSKVWIVREGKLASRTVFNDSHITARSAQEETPCSARPSRPARNSYGKRSSNKMHNLVVSCLAVAYLSANVYAIVKMRVFELARSRKHLLLYGVPFILWGSLILLGCKLMEIMRRFDEWAA
jgi:hypothetical protein